MGNNVIMRFGKSSRAAGSESGAGGRRLLWTNPNPTASFSAQNVAIDLSGYFEIIVTATATTSSVSYGEACSTVVRIGGGNYLVTYGGSNGDVATIRSVAASLADVAFGRAIFNGSTSNGRVIPYQIFGVK